MNDDVFQIYLDEIGTIVPCTEEETVSLLQACVNGETGARKRLIEGNLKTALICVESYQDRGEALSDLVQEANIALMMAVETYDGSMNQSAVEFRQYLEQMIYQALDQIVAERKAENHVEEEVLARVNVLKEVSQMMAQELGREATVEELAHRMKMTEDEIKSIMKLILDAMSVTGV